MSNEFIDQETGRIVKLGPRQDLTGEAYAIEPGVSKSHLSYLKRTESLRKYWLKYRSPLHLRPERKEDRDILLGNAATTAILQPDLFERAYLQAPNIDRRTKAGKAEMVYLQHENPGKTILFEDEWIKCMGMRDAAWKDPVTRGLLAGCDTELSTFAIDPEAGVLVKAKFQAVHHSGSHACEIRMCKDAASRAFGRECDNGLQHWQPAWCNDVSDAAAGWHPQHWVFVAIEKDPPHEIGLYQVTPEQIEIGREEAREQFRRIVEAARADHWPGLSESIRPLNMPRRRG